jgi:hypothetical protein
MRAVITPPTRTDSGSGGSILRFRAAQDCATDESPPPEKRSTMSKSSLLAVTVLLSLPLVPNADAATTVFFNPNQVASYYAEGATTDTLGCAGYVFIYTRDKLFTGGGSVPIGRPVRISWPQGVEAQYVTAGPNPGKAKITIRRQDGGLFDLTSFTAHLLANAGAGRAIEIVPMLDGEEPLNDPLYFDVSGYYGSEFSYDTSPNYLGSTAMLVGYDTYVVNLTLDYALTALTLTDDTVPSAVPDREPGVAARLLLSANPVSGPVVIRFAGGRLPADQQRDDRQFDDHQLDVYALTGARIRALRMDASGQATWDLRDAMGRSVAAGVYFVRPAFPAGSSLGTRIVVAR